MKGGGGGAVHFRSDIRKVGGGGGGGRTVHFRPIYKKWGGQSTSGLIPLFGTQKIRYRE